MACSPSIRSRVIPSYGTRRRANPGDIGFGSATVALFSLSRGAARGFHNFGDSERQDAPIRALVTDIDLGTQVTGWDVARRARELQADIPVVYMTGGSADEWSANGVPNSILIAKPFVPTQIVVAVSPLLNAAPPGAA